MNIFKNWQNKRQADLFDEMAATTPQTELANTIGPEAAIKASIKFPENIEGQLKAHYAISVKGFYTTHFVAYYNDQPLSVVYNFVHNIMSDDTTWGFCLYYIRTGETSIVTEQKRTDYNAIEGLSKEEFDKLLIKVIIEKILDVLATDKECGAFAIRSEKNVFYDAAVSILGKHHRKKYNAYWWKIK